MTTAAAVILAYMFRSFTLSVLAVALALVGLAALPVFPQTETASVKVEPAVGRSGESPTLLGENAARTESSEVEQSEASGNASGGGGPLRLSVPRLGLEDIEVPTASSQVALDREGIIRLGDSGSPSAEGSNTVIVGHALGFAQTENPYVFYELDKLERGDEIFVEDSAGEKYTYRVYDFMTLRPADYWATYPVENKSVISLQSCLPDEAPTFEHRLIVRGELVEA